jgi:CheY-like chemotaxis protein
VVVVFATPPFWLANAMTLALPVTWCSDHGRVDPSSSAIRTRRRSSFIRSPPRADRTQMKVLVADDSMVVRRLVCARLAADGHEVFEAEDGQAAVNVALRERPDVIVLDRQMPKMDGFEVCTRLRQDKTLGSVGILMLTDNRGEHTLIESLQRGADEFMSKPFSPRELSVRVRLLGTRVALAQAG